MTALNPAGRTLVGEAGWATGVWSMVAGGVLERDLSCVLSLWGDGERHTWDRTLSNELNHGSAFSVCSRGTESFGGGEHGEEEFFGGREETNGAEEAGRGGSCISRKGFMRLI